MLESLKLFFLGILFAFLMGTNFLYSQENPQTLSAPTLDLSQSVILTAPPLATKNKLTPIILGKERPELTKPFEEQLRAMNDPSHPIVTDFSISKPVLQMVCEKNREPLMAWLISILGDEEEANAFFDKYCSQLLKNFELGVDGKLTIYPNFLSAKLDINNPENEKTHPLDPKLIKNDPTVHQVQLARADVEIDANPKLQFSGLHFYTKELPSNKKNEVNSLHLDLSDVRLGQPPWFYVISQLNQVFQRTEDQVVMDSKVLKFSNGADQDQMGKNGENFKPKELPAEAARSLSKDRTPEKMAELLKGKTPVYIFNYRNLSGDWQEDWAFKDSETEKQVSALKAAGKLKYIVESQIHFEKRPAPFHFEESWFGSGLPQNYLAINTVEDVTRQVFTPEMWNTVTDIFRNSPSLQKIVHEAESDFNSTIIPHLREKKITVSVLGEQTADGKVVTHYELDHAAFETNAIAFKTKGKLVYAAELSLPLAIKSAEIAFEKPFIISASMKLDQMIPVEGKVFFVDPQKFNRVSLGVSGTLYDQLFEKVTSVDFGQAPLKISGNIELPDKAFHAAIPITWHKYGADIDENNLSISLDPLKDAQIQNVKIVWPGLESTPLRENQFVEDLPNFLSAAVKNSAAKKTLNDLTKAASAMIYQTLVSETKTLTDPKNKNHILNIDTLKTSKNGIAASLIIHSVSLSPEGLQCEVVDKLAESEKTLMDPKALMRLSSDRAALAKAPAIQSWACTLRLPKSISFEFKDLKTNAGSISHARGNFRTIKSDPIKVRIKLVKNPVTGTLWLVPEQMDIENILRNYDLVVQPTPDAKITGGFLASVAGAAQAITTRTYSDALQSEKIDGAASALIKGWKDNIPDIGDLITNELFFEIPKDIVQDHYQILSSSSPIVPDPQTSKDLSGSALQLPVIQKQARDKIVKFVHEFLHGPEPVKKNTEPSVDDTENTTNPSFISAETWKSILRDRLYRLSNDSAVVVNPLLFDLVQDQFDRLTDELNEMFRSTLAPKIRPVTSSVDLKDTTLILPTTKSVCLIEGPRKNNSGLEDAYRILLSDQENLAPVIKIPANKLPKDSTAPGSKSLISLALGYGYIMNGLQENQEKIRAIVEGTLKYEEDPTTHIQKRRSLINEKFKVEYARSHFEVQKGEPVLVIDTRMSEPFIFFRRVLPIIGNAMDWMLSPLLKVDTKNVQISISPTHEYITFTEGKPAKGVLPLVEGSMIVKSDNVHLSRRFEIQKGTFSKPVFKTLATHFVLKGAAKALSENPLNISMNTSFESDSVQYQGVSIRFDKNWVVLDIDPKLDPELLKPFSVAFKFDNSGTLNESKEVDPKKLASSGSKIPANEEPR
ncbi:MAG: hypothetical protein JWQ35_1410 [Bacteriovoracaceae bacterium]|nr:hypothetical protein [Bacteriovoracaceae bacterium]